MNSFSQQVLLPERGSRSFSFGRRISEPIDHYISSTDYWETLDELHPTPLESLDSAGRFNPLAFTMEMTPSMPWLQDLQGWHLQDWQGVGLMGLEWLLWEVCATPVPAIVFEGMVEDEDETPVMEMDWEDEVDEMDETGDVDDVDDTFIIDAIDGMDVVDEMDGTTFVEMDDAGAMDIVKMGEMDKVDEMDMVIDS
ncbi:hypothetical protein GGI43DRAFT_315307 [Trichoderma evansii]